MTTLRSAQLIVSEILYDSLGRPAITTVPVAKQNDSATTNNASQVGFITDFIKNRDPQGSDNMWVNGGKLAGSITSWVDPISFSLKEDPEYAYQGTYYETDPTSRTLQSSKPGVVFKKSADFSNPGYSNSYYTNYFPEALYDVLPPSSIQILNASGENSSFTSPNSFPYMPISAQQTSLGNLGLVTQASWTDNTSRTQVKAMVDDNNNFILKSSSYQTGAGMSDKLPSNNASTAPIMYQQQVYLPNFFDSAVNNSTSFYNKKQSNVLGQIVQTESPDQGTNVFFTDIFGRLRYSQTADQLAASMIQYYLYDALNRIIEVGVYPGSWNVSSFQENTLTPETPQPAQAQVQKSIIYDQLSTNSFDVHDLGKIVQTTTYTIRNSVEPGAYVNETYGYDSWGRIKKIIQEVTTNGNNNTFTATSNTTRYAYNGFSNVLQITYPSNFGVNYTYNIQGLVSEVSYTSNVHGGTVYSLGFYTYNAYNQITSEVLFDGNASTKIVATGYTYGNSLNQLTEISTMLVPTADPTDVSTLFSETICYTDDPGGDNTQGSYQDGNIQLTSYNYGSMSDYDYTLTYAYDAFGRLYCAGISPAGWGPWAGFGSTNQYGNFDANGNYLLDMTYITDTNQVNQATVSAYRSSYITASFGYTASGLTSSISYSSTNDEDPSYTMKLTNDLITQRPLQISLTNTAQTSDNFLYDSKGERIQKVEATNSSSSVMTYVRGQGAKVLAEYDGNNNPQTYYIQGPLGLISLYDPNAQQNSFIIRDHLGSTRLVYNASTNDVESLYAYDCFGTLFNGFGTTTSSRYLYTGQEYDQELGLYNYHARQYDPFYTKRFLSPDPAHQFASPYIYAANNSINFKDNNGKVIVVIGPDNSFLLKTIHALSELVNENRVAFTNNNITLTTTFMGNRQAILNGQIQVDPQLPESGDLVNRLLASPSTIKIQYEAGTFAETVDSDCSTLLGCIFNDVVIKVDYDVPATSDNIRLGNNQIAPEVLPVSVRDWRRLGHELIHALRRIQGDRATGTITGGPFLPNSTQVHNNYNIRTLNDLRNQETIPREEAETTGLYGYHGNNGTYPTENSIAAEHFNFRPPQAAQPLRDVGATPRIRYT